MLNMRMLTSLLLLLVVVLAAFARESGQEVWRETGSSGPALARKANSRNVRLLKDYLRQRGSLAA
jgi:hypothetical protein